MIGLFYKAVPTLTDEDKFGGSAVDAVNSSTRRRSHYSAPTTLSCCH